jgi:hypothetical protein
MPIARVASVVAPPYERKDSWEAKLRAALTALLQFLEGEPTIASLMFLDTLAAGPAIRHRRARGLHVLSDILDGGRSPMGLAATRPRCSARPSRGACSGSSTCGCFAHALSR